MPLQRSMAKQRTGRFLPLKPGYNGRTSDSDWIDFLTVPMVELRAIARPEQQQVLTELTDKIDFDLTRSYADNLFDSPEPEDNTVQEAYFKRLEMELINIATERQLREEQDPEQIEILEKLIRCESGSWKG